VVFLSTGPRPGPGADAAGARPRLGITASRKVGNAVVRNRVKRRIRAAFQSRRGLLPRAADVVVIARPAAAGLGGRTVERELADLFGREPSR
jgi:ribonuclease P protein component